MVMAELHRRPATYLPPEIQLFHILPRLPAKSVFRFMSVSKQWHSFIKTPVFAKMHLRHVTDDGDHHNHQKILLLSLRTTPHKFSTIDCDAPEDGLSVSRPFPFEYTGEFMRIMTSFHGLVCVAIFKKLRTFKFSDMVLWNPLTGEHKTLSKDDSHQQYYDSNGGAFALYYTSSDDDYKLLRTTHSYDAYIYSLKSDSWRKLEPTCMGGLRKTLSWASSSYYTPNAAVLNDKIYFLKAFYGMPSSIVRFDIKTEKFSEIGRPSFIEARSLFRYLDFFTVLKGCIHLYVFELLWDRETELWRTDGDGDWTKVGSCYIPLPLSSCPEPLHPMRNGHWIVHSGLRHCLYELDPQTLVNKFICSYAANDLHIIISSTKFVETLVSPHQYIK